MFSVADFKSTKRPKRGLAAARTAVRELRVVFFLFFLLFFPFLVPVCFWECNSTKQGSAQSLANEGEKKKKKAGKGEKRETKKKSLLHHRIPLSSPTKVLTGPIVG